MTTMINWYRASIWGMDKSTGARKIPVPTLMLWGQQDPHISYEMAPLSVGMCEEGRLVTFKDATHWVLYDEPEATSKHLVQHFLEDN